MESSEQYLTTLVLDLKQPGSLSCVLDFKITINSVQTYNKWKLYDADNWKQTKSDITVAVLFFYLELRNICQLGDSWKAFWSIDIMI